MAREAELVIKATSDLTEAKANFEKMIADFESRDIKLKFSGAPEPGNPATFGNAGGTPVAGAVASERLDTAAMYRGGAGYVPIENGTPGLIPGNRGTSSVQPPAGEQLRQQAVARQASGVPEGFGSQQSVDLTRRVLEGSPALPAYGTSKRYTDSGVPVTPLDRLHEAMTNAQVAAEYYKDTDEGPAYNRQATLAEKRYNEARDPFGTVSQRNRDDADFAKFREYERAGQRFDDARDSAALRAQTGGGTRLGGLNNRLRDAQDALDANRGTADERGYQREYDTLLGEQAIARGDASPVGGGPRRENAKPSWYGNKQSLIAAGVAGTYAGLSFVENAANYQADVIGARGQQQGMLNASVRQTEGLLGFNVLGIPVGAGVGAMAGSQTQLAGIKNTGADADLASQLVASRQATYLSRNADMRQSLAAVTGYNVGQNAGQQEAIAGQIKSIGEQKGLINEFSNETIAKLTEQRKAIASQYSISDDGFAIKAMREGKSLGEFNSVEDAQAKINTMVRGSTGQIDRQIGAERDKERDRLDAQIKALQAQGSAFGTQISSGYANVEVDRASAVANRTRNPYEQLRQETYGRAYALPSNTDPETRRLAEYRAKIDFNAGVALMKRDNFETAGDSSYQTAAGNLRRAGSTLGGDLTAIEGRRQAEVRNVGGTGDPIKDALNGFTARRDAINAAAVGQNADARLADRQRSIGVRTFVNAANYQLADNPLQAQLEQSKGQFLQDVGSALPGSVDYRRAEAMRNSRDALIKQQFANGTKMIDIGQKYSAIGLKQSLMDAPYAQQAAELAGIAGSGLQEANQLAFGGRQGQAEESRRQTLDRLTLAGRTQGRGFRAESFDLQNILISERDRFDVGAYTSELDARKAEVAGARLGTDPSQVFAQLAAQQSGALNSMTNPAGSNGANYTGPSKDDLQNMLQNFLTNLVSSLSLS